MNTSTAVPEITYAQLEELAWQRDNLSSARAADLCISLYADYEPSELQDALSDALSDIRHACDMLGLSFDKIDDEAYRCYQQYKGDHGIAKLVP